MDTKNKEANVEEPGKSTEVLYEGDENEERGNWSGKLDFLLSCLGYAVGLGNVWRFPYLCYKFGGGAFLVPYTFMLIFIGIPIFLLELTVGQYSAMAPITMYKNMVPLFRGIGWSMFLCSLMIAIYYNNIIAWTIYYLFRSFTNHLPWQDCGQSFNTDKCFIKEDYDRCCQAERLLDNINMTKGLCMDDNVNTFMNTTCYKAQDSCVGDNVADIFSNGTCFMDVTEKLCLADNDKNQFSNNTCLLNRLTDTCVGDNVENIFSSNICYNKTYAMEEKGINETIAKALRVSPPEEFLTKSVFFETSDGIDQLGVVQWDMCLCLLLAWIVVFFCLLKGIKSSGRVVYFTATFPYLVLIILVINGALLDGAMDGIRFYMVPKWDQVTRMEVWEGAAIQIFFSLSTAGGGLITLASYNKFHTNVLRDTMIVCFGNCITSVFAGFAVFSVLGFMAKQLNVEVADVVKSGSGLAFIAYPDAVTRMPGQVFWAILFFLMLFTLGLDSQFAIVENITSSIMDEYQWIRKKKAYLMGAVSVVGFLLGLPIATEGGRFVLELMDYYAAGWPYLFIGLTECLVVSYAYGFTNFLDDLKEIMNFSPGGYFRADLRVLYGRIAPLIIFLILILSWVQFKPLSIPFGVGQYVYPSWANIVGWLMCIIPISMIPIMGLYQFFYVYRDEPSYRKRFTMGLTPTNKWRENAMRLAEREGANARMHYVTNSSGNIVRRRGGKPSAAPGGKPDGYAYENSAMELSHL